MREFADPCSDRHHIRYELVRSELAKYNRIASKDKPISAGRDFSSGCATASFSLCLVLLRPAVLKLDCMPVEHIAAQKYA